MPTTEEMKELTEAINAAVPEITWDKRETIRGWLSRLEVAAFGFVRGGETAAGWEKLMAVERQVQEFIAQREHALFASIDPKVLRRTAQQVADNAEILETTWQGIRNWEGAQERQDAAALRAYAAQLEGSR